MKNMVNIQNKIDTLKLGKKLNEKIFEENFFSFNEKGEHKMTMLDLYDDLQISEEQEFFTDYCLWYTLMKIGEKHEHMREEVFNETCKLVDKIDLENVQSDLEAIAELEISQIEKEELELTFTGKLSEDSFKYLLLLKLLRFKEHFLVQLLPYYPDVRDEYKRNIDVYYDLRNGEILTDEVEIGGYNKWDPEKSNQCLAVWKSFLFNNNFEEVYKMSLDVSLDMFSQPLTGLSPEMSQKRMQYAAFIKEKIFQNSKEEEESQVQSL